MKFKEKVNFQPDQFKQVVLGCYTNDLNDFKQFVIKAKKSGATHIQINAEDLPLAYWEMTPPGDPYPAWVITNPGILKTFIPGALKKYIPHEIADNVIAILEQRCKILRKYGLKAAFHTFESQMLPEAVYEDHPDWRGPQVDHPTRSKTPRFAPSVDNPEVLKLYTEAMKIFINRCPEVDILVFRTNDSGAGFDWAPHLYHGENGNNNYKNRSMSDRIKGFFFALQKGAKEAGGTLAVQVYDTYDNAWDIAQKLDANMAIDGFEGPTGTRFSAEVGTLLYYNRDFSPVAGIPRPLDFLEQLAGARHSDAPKLFVSIADCYNKDLYLKIYDKYWGFSLDRIIDNLQFLREIAVSEVGEKDAEKLFGLWIELDHTQKTLQLLNIGGTAFIIGGIQQRWITRPLVPFPAELKPEEKDYYRKHIFSAGSDDEADNMLIMQGVRAYLGEGGRHFGSRILYRAKWHVGDAARLCNQLVNSLEDDKKKKEYELLSVRLEAFDCLINNMLNVINYQYQSNQIALIRKKSAEGGLVQGLDISSRQKMLQTARREIDNTVNLIKLLEKYDGKNNIIEHAKTKEEEYVRLLGPDLIDQLYKKIKIMNAHWTDYNRIFALPNP